MKKKIDAMKAVYTYFFPEVRGVIQRMERLDEKLLRTNLAFEEGQKLVDKYGFKEKLIVTKNLEGKLDLDHLHEPAIKRIVDIYEDTALHLKDFEYRYPTAGSSEGLFHVLAELKAHGKERIFTLNGEYEGYKEYAKTLGMKTKEVKLETALKTEKENFFISNPSATDGNIIPNELINQIATRNKVYLDLAYAGSTREYAFDLSHPNIEAAFLSFSKPYGVFRYRIGFTFTRQQTNSLFANKWFKDIQRVLTGLKIAEEIGPKELHLMYRYVQKNIVAEINLKHDLGLEPSDTLLLAHIPKDKTKMLNQKKKDLLLDFKRGDGYRLCLTPYYEKLESEGAR